MMEQMKMEIKVGQQVKFATIVDPEDESARFRVLEVNGDRLLIEFVCDMSIPPTQVVRVADVIPVDD